MPTITAVGQRNNVVRPDLITVHGDVEIIAAGWMGDKFRPAPMQLIDKAELDRIIVRSGHPGRTTKTLEYLVRGDGEMTITYSATCSPRTINTSSRNRLFSMGRSTWSMRATTRNGWLGFNCFWPYLFCLGIKEKF